MSATASSTLPRTTGQPGGFSVNRFGERFLPTVNGHAFDRTASRVLHDQQFGAAFAEAQRLHVILGTDSGLLLQYVRALKPAEGSRFLFVELPEVLEELKDAGLLDALPAHIAVEDLNGAIKRGAAFDLMRYAMRREIRTHESLAVQELVCADYLRLKDDVRNWLQPNLHRAGVSMNIAPFMIRQLENLGESIRPASVLENCWAGRTAVVMAGGPSLDEQLPWIIEHRAQLMLIAVSRIARLLQSHNIVPDIVVSVDPYHLSFDVSKEMLDLPADTLFAYTFHATPMLVGQWPWQTVYMGTRFPWKTSRNPRNLMPSGDTVTNHAVDLAMSLGCGEIVLAGVNLCYSATGQTHASGSHESTAGPLISSSSLTVTTNDGREAPTDSPFRSAAQNFATKAAAAKLKNIRLVNPAGAAARIAGVDFVALDQIHVDATPDQGSAREALRGRLPAVDGDARRAHYEAMRAELRAARKELDDIRKACRAGLDAAKQLYDRNGRVDPRFEKRRDAAIERITQAPLCLAEVMQHFNGYEFTRLMGVENPRELDRREKDKTVSEYFSVMLRTADQFERQIDLADERLQARQEEEKADPDFEKMLAQWQQDGQAARAVLLMQRRPELRTNMSPALQARFDEYASVFRSMMSPDFKGRTDVIKQRRNPLLSRPKALQHLQSQDRAALEALSQNLRQYPDGDDRDAMIHLVDGMLDELQGADEGALAHYQAVIDQAHPLLSEDALLRVSVVALKHGDFDLAGVVFQCLGEKAPRYKLQHAEILRLKGRLDEAATVMNEYLAGAPDDKLAQQRLADIKQALDNTKTSARH